MIYPPRKTLADHRVVLLRCKDYSQVLPAIAQGIECLGGFGDICTGNCYLLKPNLLLGDKPERGSTTHPDFFKAVAEKFSSEGYRLIYGDSPGFGSPQSAARASGLVDIAEKFGIELADFLQGVDVHHPDGILMKQFNVARGLLDADGLINLPKMKTHALTRLTGAVKNLFGCLPGVQKAAFHARLQDEFCFSEMLIDLAALISPQLHIMDAVYAMEGNGPRNGQLRQVGLILLSANPHALDHCVARLMNLDPKLVPTLKAAELHGLYQPEKIEVLGEPLMEHVMIDFQVNRSGASTTGPKSVYMDVFKQLVTPKPIIIAEKCTRCGRCVQVCPAEPKAVGFSNDRKTPPDYNYQQCIRCYCCQEMCPEAAITIETPFFGRLFNKINL